MKYDIQNINTALVDLINISGVKFKWKDTNYPSIGVLAHEVANVYPELVLTVHGKKTVNYNGLVGVLIEAVKELNRKIDKLSEK